MPVSSYQQIRAEREQCREWPNTVSTQFHEDPGKRPRKHHMAGRKAAIFRTLQKIEGVPCAFHHVSRYRNAEKRLQYLAVDAVGTDRGETSDHQRFRESR